ncbi:basic-leucine zipper transcription factor A [Aedes albopictus]|uniref:MANSC domain-containing protein n=1 Tax=Aedes albopictus TaxID=7160 RepID=A0ABM1XW53_AEDAL
MVDIICLMALMGTVLAAAGAESWPEGFSTSQHSIVKRMDLETCLVRFDVHLNTIIRTEESRSMGAKFLDDADVSSREQCLRLCCETEKCDVFVFEEKNQGTCFLFQCGPSNDFHCKFTHHGNYTSAVLKIPSVEQPPPPLVTQIHSLVQPPSPPQMAVIVPQLSQHERELVSLKAPKTAARSEQTTTAPLLPPLGVQLGQLPTTTTPKPTTPMQCGHYEFPCHSGECIAIYNACDGIPQCSDGSDEGPECRRPPPIKPFQPAPVQQQQQQQLQQQAQQISTNQVNDMPPVKSIMSQVFQPDLQQQQLRGLQEQQKLRNQMPHNREDPMTAPKASWSRPAIDQQSAYIDTADSRIFNHKGGLQLSSNNAAAAQYQFPETSYVPNIPRNNPYMPIPDSFQPGSQWNDPRMSPPQRPMWSQSQQVPQEQYVQPPPQHQPDVTQLQPIQTIPSNPPSPPQPQAAATPVVSEPKSLPQNAETTKNSENHISGKSSEEYESYDEQQYPEKPSNEDQEEPEKPEPPQQKKKPRKHHHQHQHDEEHKKRKSKTAKKDKAVHESEGHMPPVHEHLKMLRTDLEIEFADHDGQAERPGGAVLSLTLGAILTAALAILIGCRMKVARRRIRRQGKGSYAHDADFLVNGMYL